MVAWTTNCRSFDKTIRPGDCSGPFCTRSADKEASFISCVGRSTSASQKHWLFSQGSDVSFKSENRWISSAYYAAAIAICAGSSMISAWAAALVHRHPTYSRSHRLAKLIHGVLSRRDPCPRSLIQPRAQSRQATSCPPICRKRSGSSMTTNSTNCYPRSLPSRSDGAGSSRLKSPSRGASKWSLPPH